MINENYQYVVIDKNIVKDQHYYSVLESAYEKYVDESLDPIRVELAQDLVSDSEDEEDNEEDVLTYDQAYKELADYDFFSTMKQENLDDLEDRLEFFESLLEEDEINGEELSDRMINCLEQRVALYSIFLWLGEEAYE